MPTLIELPEIDDCASLCRELGLQFIELNMNLPQYQVNTIDLVKLNTPPETVPLDRTNGAAKPLKWCMITAAMVH